MSGTGTKILDLVISNGIQALFALLVPIMSAAGMYLVAWLRTKVKRERAAAALERLTDATITATKAVEQQMRPLFDRARADGVITAQERSQLKQEAMRLTLEQLTQAGIGEIRRALGAKDDGALAEQIDTRIEAAVHDMRREQGRRFNVVSGEFRGK